jgi:type IV secretion system protein VirB4
VLGLVEGFMPELGWLNDEETLTYLHSTVSIKHQRVRVPEIPMYLDAARTGVGQVGTPRWHL